MFKQLHLIYRNAPAPLRKVIVALSPIARTVLAPFVSQVDIGGTRMFLDHRDNACFRYLRWGAEYEHVTVSALRSVASRPGRKIFFDVGAAYGFYSLALARVDRERLERIIAFEPDPRCIQAFRKSVAHNGLDHITAEQMVVGDVDGQASLLTSSRSSTSNRSFESEEGAFKSDQSVSLPAVTLDSYFQLPDGPFAAIFKIDVEGNEGRVIRGARRILAAATSWVIQIEFFPVGMREVHQPRGDLMDLLRELDPDWCYVERPAHMEKLAGLSGLFADMDTYCDDPDYRGIGTAANYIIGKGLADLEAAPADDIALRNGNIAPSPAEKPAQLIATRP